VTTLHSALTPRRKSFRSTASGLALGNASYLFRQPFRLLLPCILLAISACSRFHHEEHSYVYVSARQVYLHDRVAAVSNRVGLVTNGEALEVIEKGKRFYKVKTPKGEIGWLEEHAVIDDKLYGEFQELTKKHAQDPVINQAELRDDLYLHVRPGRDTDHFLLIPGNAKVQLLARGTVPRTQGPGMLTSLKPKTPAKAAVPAAPSGQQKPQTPAAKPAAPATVATPAVSDVPPAPVPMEDWWLVKDSSGHTGWLLANRLDVDVPEEVGGYAEGMRMVGAYPIAKVMDSGVERKAERKGSGKGEKTKKPEPKLETDEPATATPVDHTEYVTVLSPPKGGLPYDFDQLRVFTWSLNHHRYETGYRLRGIQGYLPVTLGKETVNGQTFPTFSFQIASGPNVSIDPDTGVTRPVAPRTLAFRLEGNLIRRTGADQAPLVLIKDSANPDAGKAKSKATAKKKKR
jgi:hypothetical protein